MKNMISRNGKKCPSYADAFYGSSTIGERGQIVIPAEARSEMGYQPGDKVLIMRHPMHEGLVILKIEGLREFLDDFAMTITELEDKAKSEEEDNK